jgi:uncharacterized repeat protein (TIGR03837 family)
MLRRRVWDIFCAVVDNHGDLGVCWRLARQLRDAGQRVRLWVDDASALAWMAPAAVQDPEPDICVLPWAQAHPGPLLERLGSADVWVEAFGCTLPEAFVAHGVGSRASPPAWINLEYLSAEPCIERLHGLPSPVMSGPARGWTKHFFYPGFTPRTGGLLRESDLAARQQAFDRAAWRARCAPQGPAAGHWVSLFCYEPAPLAQLLEQLRHRRAHLLVTPGRARAAMQQALAAAPAPPDWTALPYVSQPDFDEMLWGCDLNFVRGEDSLVRALWAGQPLVWQIYPQDDQAHHAKLEAFLDWMQAPSSLRRFHRVWNGLEGGALPALDEAVWSEWTACAQAARQVLAQQDDLVTGLLRWVRQRTPD